MGGRRVVTVLYYEPSISTKLILFFHQFTKYDKKMQQKKSKSFWHVKKIKKGWRMSHCLFENLLHCLLNCVEV